MIGLTLALALGAAGTGLEPPAGTLARVAPAPLHLYTIAWHRPIVSGAAYDYRPVETGGVAVAPLVIAAPGPHPNASVAIFGTRDGWIHALREDGSVVWERKTGGAVSGTPLVDGDTVYVGGSDGKLRALAVATGKVRWTYDAKEELGTLPSLAGGTLYVASLQDTVFAVDASTGAWKWHHRRTTAGAGKFTVRGAARAIASGGTVFAAYSDGNVAALDGETGAPRWERLVAPPGDLLDIDSLAFDRGRLYAAAYSGAVLALDPATGAVVWSFQAPGATRVAVSGGTVVAVTTSSIFGLARDSGRALWTTPLDGAPGAAPPVFGGGWILVPAGKGGLKFLEPSSGRVLRVLDPGTGVDAAPAVHEGRVYVLSNGGDLFALDLS
jgi:outer membrane protein assembly factor BamB